MQFVRLIVGGFILLSITYFAVSWYSRSVRREKLEKWWDEAPVDGVTRDDYIAEGMDVYENGLRKKLILLIFVIPPIVVATIMVLVN